MHKTSILSAIAATALLIATTASSHAAYGPIPYSGDRLELMTTYVDLDALGAAGGIAGYAPLPYSGNGLEQASTWVDIDAMVGLEAVTSVAEITPMMSEPAGVPYAAWRMAMPGLTGGYVD